MIRNLFFGVASIAGTLLLVAVSAPPLAYI